MENKMKKDLNGGGTQQEMTALLQRLSVEDQQKLMMLRAHGLLDDSEMVDFIRMAAAQGGSSNLMSQYEKMLIDYEDDEDEEGDEEHEFDEAELAQIA
jgi:hypothetical protein